MSNFDFLYMIGYQFIELLCWMYGFGKVVVWQCVWEVFLWVGLFDFDCVMCSYLYQVFGGMVQCVFIVGVIVGCFLFFVVDEFIIVFDVIVQVEVFELLWELQVEYGMVLFIVMYNFGVVVDICDCVIVMCGGDIVEFGFVDDFFVVFDQDYMCEFIVVLFDEVEGCVEFDWYRMEVFV